MSRFWRSVSIAGGAAAIILGALLLMGNLRQAQSQAVELEQVRLETLARSWEGRLETARETFHDRIVQNDLLPILEHPADWSPWRVQPRLTAMGENWTAESGSVRAFILLLPSGQVHSSIGDTSGLDYARTTIVSDPLLDLVLWNPGTVGTQLLALDYRPPQIDSSDSPGHIIVLLDATPLFRATGKSFGNWVLLSAPGTALAASSPQPAPVAISDAAWKLLLQTEAGAVPQTEDGTLCFARISLPGSAPLLLVQPFRARASASLFGFALLFLGLGVLLTRTLRMQPTPVTGLASAATPDADPTGAEAAGLRQIFQTIDDPLCVIDGNGGVLRANHKAQDWLRDLRAEDAPPVQTTGGALPLTEFLSRAAEDPSAVSAPGRLTVAGQRVAFDLQATRLHRDSAGRGPVLLHFRPQPAAGQMRHQASSATATGVESSCPFPVLSVNPAGFVTSYNEAARQACPRLAHTPLLSELLPGIEARSLPTLLNSEPGSTFESLFGSSPHEFTVIRGDDRLLLYAHRLSESKQLEVDLKQAQENFFGLCALVPAAILLVDPRDHAIIEANAAAGDLFRCTVASLRGRALDTLSDEPWNTASRDDHFTAVTSDGQAVPCAFRFELIKIEGIPTLLVILEPDQLRLEALPLPAAISAPVVALPAAPPVQPPAVPSLPAGPGILVTFDPTVREVARRLLDKLGHNCESFSCLDDATVWLITHDVRPELMAVDLLDFANTVSWVTELRDRCGDVPCLAFTDGLAYSLPATGPNALLTKPFDLDSLAAALRELNLDHAVTA